MYFLKTLTERTVIRIRPLSGQKDALGTPVRDSYNVQCDKAIRARYGVGTKFVTTELNLSTNFYTATELRVLDNSAPASDKATPEEFAAYEKFIGGVRIPFVEDEIEVTAAPKRGTMLSKIKANERLSCPKLEDGFYVKENDWYLMIRNIRTQTPTMLIGPTGTGKSELIMLLGKQTKTETNIYDMGSMYDPVAGLLGVHRLEKGGVSIFDYAKFTYDIQKSGNVLLDELSRAPVTTNNILFPCLDSRRELPVAIAGGADMRSIPLHEECCFFATANIGSEYTGTTTMDRALVGRFFPIELDYPPQEIEQQILMVRCHIQKSEAQKIVSVINNIRHQYRKQEISSTVSTREALMIGHLLKDGFPLLFSIEAVVLPLFEGSKTDGERAIIHKIIISK